MAPSQRRVVSSGWRVAALPRARRWFVFEVKGMLGMAIKPLPRRVRLPHWLYTAS